jgi:exopolysaccharide production protein ExoZ
MSELRSLTALRALAATTVIYYHIMVRTGTAFGEFGVDIFFVLSGFVIALVLNGKPITVSGFAISRITRIVPLYWLLTLLVFFLAAFRPTLFNSTTANLPNLAKSLLFIPYRKESGQLYPMLYVGWSLNYEMFFYTITAAIISFSDRLRLMLISGALLSVFFICKATNFHSPSIDFLGNERILEFILGMVAYRLWKNGVQIRSPIAALLLVAMYVGMAALELHHIKIHYFFVNGIPSFLILICALNLEPWIGEGPISSMLCLLGRASYATYLCHPYVVEMARKLLPKLLPGFDVISPGWAVLTIVLSSLAGVGLFYLVDKPLQTAVKRLARRQYPNVPPGVEITSS